MSLKYLRISHKCVAVSHFVVEDFNKGTVYVKANSLKWF